MSFYSTAFLLFLPFFLSGYFLTRGRLRLVVCLAGSYIFYGWADWRFAGLLAGSTSIDYLLSRRLMGTSEMKGRKALLVASITLNIGLLVLFKYFNFFVEGFSAIISYGAAQHSASLTLILPVGISFYTFQKIGYMVDLYRGAIDGEKSFLRFATFVAFFPKLMAGPIVSAPKFLPQLQTDHPLDWNKITGGLELMLQGFFKKAVIANSLGVVVDNFFAHPEFQTSLTLMVGAIFYSFQIYCDFSGYSDIAIGLGRVLGFDLGINFERPYFAMSFSDFWKRWHISLSEWLRDYVYIPLGGSREGTARTIRNLLVTMLICGLWHGANWTFIVWGGLHGLYLAAQRLLGSSFRRSVEHFEGAPRTLMRVTQMLTVSVFVTIAWIFFRAPSLGSALAFLQGIGSLDNLAFSAVPLRFWVVKGILLIGMLISIEGLHLVAPRVTQALGSAHFRFATNAAMLWCIALFGVFSNSIFIYSHF